MTLFKANIKRDDTGPATYSEPSYLYLNRSARSAAAFIRQELENWLLRYPKAAKKNRDASLFPYENA